MATEIKIGTVDDEDGTTAEIVADTWGRTVDLYLSRNGELVLACLPPYRARAMISLLQEALRHLED